MKKTELKRNGALEIWLHLTNPCRIFNPFIP
jgi:hypothetical protein